MFLTIMVILAIIGIVIGVATLAALSLASNTMEELENGK